MAFGNDIRLIIFAFSDIENIEKKIDIFILDLVEKMILFVDSKWMLAHNDGCWHIMKDDE